MIQVFTIYPNTGGGGGGMVNTLNNGLTLTGANGQLGGVLIKNTVIDSTPGFSIDIGDIANEQAFLRLDAPGSVASLVAEDAPGNNGGILQLGVSVAALTAFSAAGNMGFDMTLSSFLVQDDINLKGMVYNADYSTAGLMDNRWIPDLGAVMALVAAGATIYTADAALTGNRTATIDAHTLVFTGVNGVYTVQDSMSAGVWQNEQISDTSLASINVSANGAFNQGRSTIITQDVATNTQATLDIATAGTAAQITLQVQDNAGDDTGFFISTTPLQILVKDEIGLKGMVYAADYSTAGLTDNRWIPDLGAVISLIGSSRVGQSNGTISATTTLIPAAPANTAGVYAINLAAVVASVTVGTVTFTLDYTDAGGTPRTVTLLTMTALGASSYTPIQVLPNIPTTMSVTATITGTINVVYAVSIDEV